MYPIVLAYTVTDDGKYSHMLTQSARNTFEYFGVDADTETVTFFTLDRTALDRVVEWFGDISITIPPTDTWVETAAERAASPYVFRRLPYPKGVDRG